MFYHTFLNGIQKNDRRSYKLSIGDSPHIAIGWGDMGGFQRSIHLTPEEFLNSFPPELELLYDEDGYLYGYKIDDNWPPDVLERIYAFVRRIKITPLRVRLCE